MHKVMVAIWQPVRELHRLVGDDVVIRSALKDQGRYGAGQPFDLLLTADVEGPEGLALAGLGDRVWAWVVDERKPRVGLQQCDVTMVALMRRNPELSVEQFRQHWTTNHAPLALRHHAGLHDYTQNLVVETLTPDTDEIDGVAELGFRTREEFETEFYDSDDGRRAIGEDVRRFMAGPGPDTTLLHPPN